MEQTNLSPAILRWAPARFKALTSKCNLKQAQGALVCGVKVDLLLSSQVVSTILNVSFRVEGGKKERVEKKNE